MCVWCLESLEDRILGVQGSRGQVKYTSVVRLTLLYFYLACHAVLDAASSLCFSGFLLPQE
jgi:hypothetical protein